MAATPRPTLVDRVAPWRRAKAHDLDPKTAATEIGSAGLKQRSGLIQEEFLPELRGDRALHVYKEMGANDPTVASVLFVIRMFLRGADWDVVPFDDTPEAEADAVFVEEAMQDMSHSWAAFIDDITSMFQYGWAFFEVVYKQRNGLVAHQPGESSRYADGEIGWRKMALRAHETRYRWQFDDETGGLEGMWQQASQQLGAEKVFIPIEKALLFRTSQARGNPEGQSILRVAYRSWWQKKRDEENEGVGIQSQAGRAPCAARPHRPAGGLHRPAHLRGGRRSPGDVRAVG